MEKFKVPSKVNQVLMALMAVGVISLAAGFAVQPERAWAGLLVLAFYVMIVGLFGGFFTALQFIAGAKWSVVVRRLTESMFILLPVAALLIVGVLAGMHNLYEWSHHDVVQSDHILQKKSGYLNSGFFIARLVIYFVGWIGLAYMIRKKSMAMDGMQDMTQRREGRGKIVAVSAGYMVFFAYTFALSSIDLVMSLEPHWYTTMFVLYCFAGLAYTGFGALILLTYVIQRNGGLKNVTIEHYHDIGKFQLVFTIFWAYIAFSQHMLTWYANLPEETIYLERRLAGVWGYFTIFLVIVHFFVPFFMLLSSKLKRTPDKLKRVAMLTVTMGYVDVVWLVYGGIQKHNVHGFPFSWMEVGIFAGAIGIIGYVVMNAYGRVNPEPSGDPFYSDSVNFHQTF